MRLFRGRLAIEGFVTEDGRLCELGSLRWDSLPLPLRAHSRPDRVGWVLNIVRTGPNIMVQGVVKMPEGHTDFDLAMDLSGVLQRLDPNPQLTIIREGQIRAVTLVDKCAYPDCRLVFPSVAGVEAELVDWAKKQGLA